MKGNLEWEVTYKGKLNLVDISHVEIVRAPDPRSALAAAGDKVPHDAWKLFKLEVSSVKPTGTALLQ